MPAAIPSIKKRAFLNALELKLRRSRGDMLQVFLSAVMTKVLGDNFIPATAHHSKGDLKCDGLLKTPLTVFACYGPTNAGDGQSAGSLALAVAKVSDDYLGAAKHWPDLKEWVFVSNYVSGIPPQITQQILALEKAHPEHILKIFGIDQFQVAILELDLSDIEELLGDAASDADFRNVQIPDVQAVINDITQTFANGGVSDDQPLIVSAQKLAFNNLPEVYRERIKQGFQNTGDLSEYMLNHPDPTLDGRIASIFKAKYFEFKKQALPPDEIMDLLYDFALGGQRNSTPHEVAVWSLLAHLFEKCTIFEDQPSATALQ